MVTELRYELDFFKKQRELAKQTLDVIEDFVRALENDGKNYKNSLLMSFKIT